MGMPHEEAIDVNLRDDESLPADHDRNQILEEIEALTRGALLPEEGRENGVALVLVKGASGQGKSRLIEDLLHRLGEERPNFQEVECHERQGIPFLPVLRLIKNLIVSSVAPQDLWRKYAHVLTRVFPELVVVMGESSDADPLPGEDGRIQFHQELTSILLELAQERPILLAIHDVHRCDRGTIEFITYLARNVFLSAGGQRAEGPAQDSSRSDSRDWKLIHDREGRGGESVSEFLESDDETTTAGSPRARIQVIVNFTSKDPTSRLAGERDEVLSSLAELAKEPFARRFDLSPLAPTEIARIVSSEVEAPCEPAQIDRLFEATGGNPLRALDLCRLVSESGGDWRLLDDILPAMLPRGITAAQEQLGRGIFMRRLASLPSLQLKVLRYLALLRRPADGALIAEACQSSAEAIEGAIEELIDRDFIRSRQVRNLCRYHIGHEDHLRWIRRGIEPAEARRLQSELGRILAEDPRASEPVRSFEIYEQMRSAGQLEECRDFGFSAFRFFSGAYAEHLAIRVGRELLDSLGGDGNPEMRRDVLLALISLEMGTGQLEIAKAHAKSLMGDTGLGAAPRLEGLLMLAEIYCQLGEPLKGIKALNRVPRDTVSEVGGLSEARITSKRARLRLERQDFKRAISLCLRGLKEIDGFPEELDRKSLHADLLEVLSEAHLRRGETVSALNHYQALLELVEGLGDDVRLSAVLRTLSRVYYDRGNHFRSARYLFRALEVIERTRDLRAFADTYELLGKVYRNSGDFPRSLEHFRLSLRLREKIGDSKLLSPTLNSIGSLHAHNGDYARAIRYFKRSVTNSERFGSTDGIVRSFLHLGWVFHELGERKQLESLCRQVLILSQEFDLSGLEAEGHRLSGSLAFLRGDLKTSEKEFRRSLEIAQRRGLTKLAAASHLDLAALEQRRERYEAALKLVSRGMLQAEEIQSIPIQVRGLLLKGELSRHLRGGSPERTQESYEKALSLVSGDTLLPLQWSLFYALARLHQTTLEVTEARRFYDRADQIIERISSKLPEDMRVVFRDDRRRKNFFTDLQRFRKESSEVIPVEAGGSEVRTPLGDPPRTLSSGQQPAGEILDPLIGVVERLAPAEDLGTFSQRLLEEVRRLVPSPRGFVLERIGSRWKVFSQIDMGSSESWAVDDRLPGAISLLTIDRNAVIRSGGEDWKRLIGSSQEGSSYKGRSVMSVPLIIPGRFSGVLVLERPTAGNPFLQENGKLLLKLIQLLRGQFLALVIGEGLARFTGTSIFTPSGFEAGLEDLLERQHRDKLPLGAIEMVIPGLDQLIRKRGDDGILDAFLELAGPGFDRCLRPSGDRYVFIYLGRSLEDLQQRSRDLANSLPEFRENAGLADGSEVGISVHHHPLGDASIEELRRGGAGYFCSGEAPKVENEVATLSGGEMTMKEAKLALEKRFIVAALHQSEGNVTHAAETLGMHRPQLSTLLKRHGIRREDFER